MKYPSLLVCLLVFAARCFASADDRVIFIWDAEVRNLDALVRSVPQGGRESASKVSSAATFGGALPSGCVPVAVSFLKDYVRRDEAGLAVMLCFDPEPSNQDAPLHTVAVFERAAGIWFYDQDMGEIDCQVAARDITIRGLITAVRGQYLRSHKEAVESGGRRYRNTLAPRDAYYATRSLGGTVEFHAAKKKLRGSAFTYAGRVFVYLPESGIGCLNARGSELTPETVARALRTYFDDAAVDALKL